MTASPISWAPGGSTSFPQISHTHRIHAFPYHLKPLPLRAFPFLVVIRRLLTVPSLSQSILFVSLHLKSNPFSNRLRTTQINSIPFPYATSLLYSISILFLSLPNSSLQHSPYRYFPLSSLNTSLRHTTIPFRFRSDRIATSPFHIYYYLSDLDISAPILFLL